LAENSDLLIRLKKGEEAAFDEVVRNTQKMVFNTALNLVQNRSDAEDITQDVYVKLYEKVEGFKGDSALSTWLYRITIRHALDFEKRKKRKKHGGGLRRMWIQDVDTEIVEPDNPGISLDSKEQAAYLFAAIKKLPQPQRIAFTLRQLDGLKVNEIAEILKRSEAGIESLLGRAKTNLRKYLHQYYQQFIS